MSDSVFLGIGSERTPACAGTTGAFRWGFSTALHNATSHSLHGLARFDLAQLDELDGAGLKKACADSDGGMASVRLVLLVAQIAANTIPTLSHLAYQIELAVTAVSIRESQRLTATPLRSKPSR